MYLHLFMWKTLSAKSFKNNFAITVKSPRLAFFCITWWKIQEPCSVGTSACPSEQAPLAQHCYRTNHFQKVPFPAQRLQYVPREISSGSDLKLVPHSMSSHTAFPKCSCTPPALDVYESTCPGMCSLPTDSAWQSCIISQRKLHLSPYSATEPDLTSTKEVPAD